MTYPGLLIRAYNIQIANTPWYTEYGFTVIFDAFLIVFHGIK